MLCPDGASEQEKCVQLWEIQLNISAYIVLLDATEVAGSFKAWSVELKQSVLITLGKRQSVAAQCLSFNVIWVNEPYMVVALERMG